MIARAAGTLKTGWLTKKEGLRANWKPFWFELSPTGLAYYKSDRYRTSRPPPPTLCHKHARATVHAGAAATRRARV